MVGFATLATVDISFYKDYAYFGMFGMLTLLFTTTTMIPLLLTIFPPSQELCEGKHGHRWEKRVGGGITRLLVGPGKWIPVGVVALVMVTSAYQTRFWEGTRADVYIPGVEKGINYARAAFKEGSQTWQDLEQLNEIMPGVISVSIPIRGREARIADLHRDALPRGAVRHRGPRRAKAQCRALRAGTRLLGSRPLRRPGHLQRRRRARRHREAGELDARASVHRLHRFLRAVHPAGEHAADRRDRRAAGHRRSAHPNPSTCLAIDPDDDRDPNEIVQLYNGLLETMTSAGDMDSFVIPRLERGGGAGLHQHHAPGGDPPGHDGHPAVHGGAQERPGLQQGAFRSALGPVDGPVRGHQRAVGRGPDYVRPGVGGFLGATEATREVAMDEWLRSPLQTALAIFIIAALMFRSFSVAGILLGTLLITLFAQYGIGGYFTSVENWSGNLAFHLLVTLSIAMGLGVDYGIYMISRLKEEMQATGNNWLEALRNTQNTTGSAVIVSVFVLLGSFIPLVGTDLANTWGLAMYIGAALILHVFTALMLLPLMVKWIRPKYVFGTAA
jgi:uncharacterized protein